MIGDAELRTFRHEYYTLFVALLWREPDPDVVAALARGLEERTAAAEALHQRMGEGWREIGAFLARTPSDALGEAVADEYTRLFLGPFNRELNPYESYYLVGTLLDRPLAVLRDLLREFGLARQEGYAEPEDFLAFELDVMRRLIERQAAAPDPDAEVEALNRQARFLKRHLLVWGPRAARDLAEARGAAFYRGVGRLLEGFLELERRWFEPWGPEAVPTLEEARRRYAGTGQWRGPLFDPARGLEGGGASSSSDR